MIRFQISKTKSLFDEFIRIQICGIQNLKELTVSAIYRNEKSVFKSFAHYYTPQNSKTLDLVHSRSIGGSYIGIEPLGLLWAMKPAPGYEGNPFQNFVSTAADPFIINLQAHAGHIKPKQFSNESLLCESSLERYHLSDNVDRIEVRSGRLRGTLFQPRGFKSCPGVLDISGATGGLYEDRAALLASKGFATFALAYFAFDDLPKNLLEEDLDYFEEGIDWMLSQPGIQKTGVGAFGRSKGAEIISHLACYLPETKLRAAFCLCPLSYMTVWPARYQGRIVLDPLGFPLEDGYMSDRGLVVNEINMDRLGLENTIPIDRAKAQIIFAVAGDDGMATKNAAQLLAEKMTRAGRRNFEIVRFPATGHMLDHPFTPSIQQLNSKLFHSLTCVGGTAFDNHVAQLRCWLKMQAFFTKHVGSPVPL